MKLKVWDFNKSGIEPAITCETKTDDDKSHGGPYADPERNGEIGLCWHIKGYTLMMYLKSFEAQDIVDQLTKRLKGSTAMPDYDAQSHKTKFEKSFYGLPSEDQLDAVHAGADHEETDATLTALKDKLNRYAADNDRSNWFNSFRNVLGLSDNQEIVSVRPVEYLVEVKTTDEHCASTTTHVVTIN